MCTNKHSASIFGHHCSKSTSSQSFLGHGKVAKPALDRPKCDNPCLLLRCSCMHTCTWLHAHTCMNAACVRTGHEYNSNNREFMEHFQRLKVLYNLKTCNSQIPIYKSMVYKQTKHTQIKRFHTKHGKICTHTWSWALTHSPTYTGLHAHTNMKLVMGDQF